MADIVVANAKKVNFLDRIIQSVVITVNLNKMNRAIEEHIDKFREAQSDKEKSDNLEKVLREIVYLKYQYEIIQRNMYELKLTYADDLVQNINTVDKMERLKIQKTLFEMEYERLSKSKFHSKESIKYRLLTVSSVLDKIKQEIKDEGKLEKYSVIIKRGESIDEKIANDSYSDEMYDDLITAVNAYTSYINDNYDIAKLPSDERELIELVFEATLNDKLSSDIDRYNHEFNLLVNICKNEYLYFKAIDKVLEKILSIYDDMYVTDVLEYSDYMAFFRELFDIRIKTRVNDVKRTLDIEDEYLNYCKILMEPEELDEYLLDQAISFTKNSEAKEKLLALKKIEEKKCDEIKIVEDSKKVKSESEVKEKIKEEKADSVKIDPEIEKSIEEVLNNKQIEETPIKVRRRNRTVEEKTEKAEETMETEEEIRPRRRKGLGSFGRRKVEQA